MRVFLFILTLKVISCTYEYYYDVNQFHGPLTTLDKASKTVKYCIYLNNMTLDNNYLIGTWYTVSKFVKGITGLSHKYCKMTNFTRSTKQDVDEYKAKYDLRNETFKFGSSAVICSQLQGGSTVVKGMVVGGKTAKYYFVDPKSSQRISGMYDVLTYKPVNNDYLIYYECSMRGHVKYLWSRKRNQTDEELESVIKPLYELEDLDHERYCKKDKVVSNTPYF